MANVSGQAAGGGGGGGSPVSRRDSVLQKTQMAEQHLLAPGSSASGRTRRLSVPLVVADELLDVYKRQGRLDDAVQLIFSESSPVPKAEQKLLDQIVRLLQAAFRKRRAAATCIAAGERGRLDRDIARWFRDQQTAAMLFQAAYRGHKSRWHTAILAEQRRLNRAATVLQRRQRGKVEERKPQWPWRLALMAARVHARKRMSARVDPKVKAEALIFGAKSAPPAAPKVRGEGQATLNALGSGGVGRRVSIDPRAGG